jgi:hypothetical protein
MMPPSDDPIGNNRASIDPPETRVGPDPQEISETFVNARSKWRLIAGFWLAQAAFILLIGPVLEMQGATVGGPQFPLGYWRWDRIPHTFARWDYWEAIVLSIIGLMALQTILIWPVRRPRARQIGGWPVWLSLGAATLAGTALAAALYLGFSTITQLNNNLDPHWSYNTARAAFITWCGICYILIGLLLYGFCSRRLRRGERYESILARISSRIFAGTLIEAAAIMPLDILFRRRQDCYCFAGSFWAFMVLLAAGLVAAGPAIFLPILMKRRKRWYASRCDACGYDMTGSLAGGREVDRCPECGAGWKPERVP